MIYCIRLFKRAVNLVFLLDLPGVHYLRDAFVHLVMRLVDECAGID